MLAKTRKLLGKPLDLLGMDACLMSCLEVAFQSAGDVRAIVSSEELEPGDGWPYDKILADLRAKPTMDGAALGKAVVKRYIESYKNRTDQWPVTMCAVHSAGVEGFSDKLDAFTMALRRAIKDDDVDAARLLRAHTRSVRFDGDLIDLKTFCEQVRTQPFAAAVKTPAKKVLDALAVGGDLVVANSTLGPEGRALRRRHRLPAGADRRDLAVLQGPEVRPAPRLGRVPAQLPAGGAGRVACMRDAPDPGPSAPLARAPARARACASAAGARVAVAPGARVVLGPGASLGEGARIDAVGGTVRVGAGRAARRARRRRLARGRGDRRRAR